MSSLTAAGFSEDAFLGGRLRLRQPLSGHRSGHDAVLLAAATPASSGQRVVDFGAGVGAAGLAVARRVPDIDLILIERDAELAELARANVVLNGFEAQVHTLDVTAPSETFAAVDIAPDSVDVVVMNPPFNDPARHRSSPDATRRIAHMASPDMLATWAQTARRVLKSRGTLSLIWRGDGLKDVLTALDRGFGGIVILPIHRDPVTPAMRVLVCAVKGSQAPLRLLPSLVLNDESGVPNKRVQELLVGAALAPL